MTQGATAAAPNGTSPILIVEDDKDTAEGMARFLKHFGYQVEIAHDGHQAIEFARLHRPHYVLLDLGLPGLDGYDVASRLRQECAEPLVIIAITGYGREDDRRRCREAGIDHHLLKPAGLDTVLSLLAAQGEVGSSHP